MDIPHILVLDTGPLTDFLIEKYGTLYRLTNKTKFRATSLPGSCQAAFALFLSRVQRRVTVSGVFVEVHSHFRKNLQESGLSKPEKSLHIGQFRKFLAEETQRMALEEEFVKLAEIPLPELELIGPVNAAIFTLARRYITQKVAIIADDRTLKKACEQAQIAYIWSRSLGNQQFSQP